MHLEGVVGGSRIPDGTKLTARTLHNDDEDEFMKHDTQYETIKFGNTTRRELEDLEQLETAVSLDRNTILDVSPVDIPAKNRNPNDVLNLKAGTRCRVAKTINGETMMLDCILWDYLEKDDGIRYARCTIIESEEASENNKEGKHVEVPARSLVLMEDGGEVIVD